MKNEIAELCRQLSLGAYVVGVADHHSHDAFAACSVMQASREPVLLAVSVNPEHRSYPLIRTAGSFSVNVLRKDQADVAGLFDMRRGHAFDRLRNVSWSRGQTGAPILDDSLAWFECELTAVMPAGDHQILLGRVVNGGIQETEDTPVAYAGTADGRRYYQETYF